MKMKAFIILLSFSVMLCGVDAMGKNGTRRQKSPAKSAPAKPQKEQKEAEKESPGETRNAADTGERNVKDERTGTEEKAPADARDQKAVTEDKKTDRGELNDLYKYDKPTLEEESYGWLIFKTILVMGFLGGGFYLFFRFVTKKAGMNFTGGDVVNVLAVVPIGQNKFLQVIDVAGRVMVIGVADNTINLITEITDRDDVDRIRLLSSKSTPVRPGGFQEFITAQIGRLFKPKGAVPVEPDAVHHAHQNENDIDRLEYLRRQRERLRRMDGYGHEE